MFQFTPYQTCYADYAYPSNYYSLNLAPDTSFQPYLLYLQSTTEIYKNCILQNA